MNLGKAITEAHLRTCLYSNEQIDLLKHQQLPAETVEMYKNLVGQHIFFGETIIIYFHFYMNIYY